jgi:hypothetical protein
MQLLLYLKSYDFISAVEHAAQQDAARITRQLTATQLTALKLGDPNAPLSSGSSTDNGATIPYISQPSASNQFTPFALLITPDRNVAVSSYSARYPIKAPINKLIPYATGMINTALAGSSEKGKNLCYSMIERSCGCILRLCGIYNSHSSPIPMSTSSPAAIRLPGFSMLPNWRTNIFMSGIQI